ncbi:MAG TPA: SMC family ATPase [Candidatus Nitrosocosmicus sp.]|nr:SMC family ATPase [Candidatus Nitrosocosmicus sp.]
MIKRIVLNNFLSHTDTSLEFHPGITVFVGHNGSGKSSIVDSITFALFDEHTRKSHKNLLTRGIGSGYVNNETGSYVILEFSIGPTNYRIKRQIDSQGRLTSVRLEQKVKNSNNSLNMDQNERSIYRSIISGERKQLGESVIHKTESIMGINYTKLQIAGVIQQGEISKIIDSQPKEFKELLNNMIGLDRLDKSFINMHGVIEDFRKILREKTQGYDDNQINILIKKIKDNESRFLQSKQSLNAILIELSQKTETLNELEKQIEILEPKIAKLSEIRSLENTLLKYFQERSNSLKTEIDKSQRMIVDIKNAVRFLRDKDEVFITIQMVSSELDELNSKVIQVEGEIGKLKGFTECAQKIQIKDGKCPVCNSEIISLNQMFDISHINFEIHKKIKEKQFLLSEISKLNKEEMEFKRKEKNIISAERTLLNYDFDNGGSIDSLEHKLDDLKKDYQSLSKLQLDTLININLSEYKLDDYSTNLIDIIQNMRNDVIEVDLNSYKQKKLTKNKLSAELVNIHNQRAILEKTIVDIQSENSEFQTLITELSSAAKFISDLENIRSTVFNRDGIVSSSLRTRALNLISTKASEYINIFNVGLSKVTLIEKPREIKVLCYGKRGEIDTVSLSGGEKVAVSLAIRMGIAFLMGSSKIDFIVLDEPTTNLDEERRRSFVKIISNVFSKGMSPLSQMIIITHDEEIFENSEVEQVYKFRMTEKGSSVNVV